jgi:hypothetical protein
MNYERHYDLLIERARGRVLENVYVEKHHVVPSCLGGSDGADNIVNLLPEEHYLAHQLLVKMYPQESKLYYAALMMTVSNERIHRNNKTYSWIRRKVSENRRIRQTGLKHSESSKQLRSAKLKGKPLSDSTKQKLIDAWVRRRSEKPMTEDTKQKLKVASTGKTHSVETKMKLSEYRKANPVKRKVPTHAV